MHVRSLIDYGIIIFGQTELEQIKKLDTLLYGASRIVTFVDQHEQEEYI